MVCVRPNLRYACRWSTYHGRVFFFKTILISSKIWYSLVACIYQVLPDTKNFSNCVLSSTNKRVVAAMSCMLPQTTDLNLPNWKILLLVDLISDSPTHTASFFAALSVSPETVRSLWTTVACLNVCTQVIGNIFWYVRSNVPKPLCDYKRRRSGGHR